jgi:hypothetical protein
MVIGARFAWGHLQKTGGDATTELFRMFPDVVEFADPRNIEAKHASFAERADQVRGKLLVANIRRLPSWTLSWAQHRARLSKRPDGSPVPMNSPRQMITVPRADMRLALLTGDGAFPVDRWLRMEHLAEDFADFLAEITEVSEEDRARIAGFGRVNALEYDHEVANWFTPEQVEQLYERNPAWAEIERRIYGDLMTLG